MASSGVNTEIEEKRHGTSTSRSPHGRDFGVVKCDAAGLGTARFKAGSGLAKGTRPVT